MHLSLVSRHALQLKLRIISPCLWSKLRCVEVCMLLLEIPLHFAACRNNSSALLKIES